MTEQIVATIIQAINEPKFEERTRCHDWRNHVSEEMMTHWHSMNTLARTLIYLQAQQRANDEEWE